LIPGANLNLIVDENCFAAKINDPTGSEYSSNTKFVVKIEYENEKILFQPETIQLIATRNINANEELYVNYGKTFFKTVTIENKRARTQTAQYDTSAYTSKLNSSSSNRHYKKQKLASTSDPKFTIVALVKKIPKFNCSSCKEKFFNADCILECPSKKHKVALHFGCFVVNHDKKFRNNEYFKCILPDCTHFMRPPQYEFVKK
jgi:hypothetical protein